MFSCVCKYGGITWPNRSAYIDSVLLNSASSILQFPREKLWSSTVVTSQDREDLQSILVQKQCNNVRSDTNVHLLRPNNLDHNNISTNLSSEIDRSNTMESNSKRVINFAAGPAKLPAGVSSMLSSYNYFTFTCINFFLPNFCNIIRAYTHMYSMCITVKINLPPCSFGLMWKITGHAAARAGSWT